MFFSDMLEKLILKMMNDSYRKSKLERIEVFILLSLLVVQLEEQEENL